MKSNTKDLSLGVERAIDNLGRLVLPKEMRNKLNFKNNQLVNIKLFPNHIRIEKATTSCYICGKEDVVNYKDTQICNDCISGIIEEFNK